MDTTKFQKIINSCIDNKMVFGTVVTISKGNEKWTGSAGNLSNNQLYFIASTTKIYISALILHLEIQGKLKIDDTIYNYLPDKTMKGLHVYKGEDYSGKISIKHLLSQTSGLPDYFEDKNEQGQILLKELMLGNDRAWTPYEAINLSKRMKPLFVPGTKGKAHYSDTNFQLLGLIIENITGKPIAQALHNLIFEPLQLNNTYLYTNSGDKSPSTFYYKNQPLHIGKAMASFGADGGIVSTAEESMIFLKAFFNGHFFPKELLPGLYVWNRVMFPLQYGTGVMRFKLPRFFSPFKAMPELIGHSGLSGAFSYYCPQKDAYITGTVNQVHSPSISYKLILQLLDVE
jgi:CubicO group peptidase (beta-lactamase class C family)